MNNANTKNQSNAKYFHGESNRDKVKIKSLRQFHHFVKSYLYKYAISHSIDPKNVSILELAAGRGADLYKYNLYNVKYVLAINGDKSAIDSFQNKFQKQSHKHYPNPKELKMDFALVDLSKNAINNVVKTVNLNTKGVKDAKFDIVSIQFAFHYFLKSKKTLDTIFKTINDHLKQNGYFIFTTFDGKLVFDSIKTHGDISIKMDGMTIFEIKKLYKQKELKDLGQEIDACVQTIGCHHEYLVNYDYILQYFKEKGYETIESDNFGHLLPEYYKTKERNRLPYPLSEQEKIFTMLNRYTILQKL